MAPDNTWQYGSFNSVYSVVTMGVAVVPEL